MIRRPPAVRAGGEDAVPLVGRTAEVERLRAAIARVAGGGPGAVLLTGPPGIGKSRLAHLALAEAAEAGFATFAGRARQLEPEVAYAPVVAAFGPYLRALPAGYRPRLLGDLPQLGLLVSGLGLPEPVALSDPAVERARLVDGLARLVHRLARDRPLVLLIDDVHAADPATVAFLAYLADSVADRPVLLLLTARPDEPGAKIGTTLRHRLAATSWATESLVVGPLTDAEGTALLAAVVGRPVTPALATAVLGHCAGRPLFIAAVARALAERGDLVESAGHADLRSGSLPLPDAVRDQLRIRLSSLGGDERRLLDALGVAGGPIDVRTLAAAAGLPIAVALDAVDTLAGRGLLVTDDSPGQVDVVHGLLRDTVRAELPPGTAARLHAAFARALSAAGDDDARVAEHVRRAGSLLDPVWALDRLVRGADRAGRVAAADDAVRLLAAAVDVARQVSPRDRLPDLLARLAAAQHRCGDLPAARATWRRAADAYAGQGAADRLAKAERELSLLDWSAGDPAAAFAHLSAAERALAGREPGSAHAELLYTRMLLASRVGDARTVSAVADRLRDLSSQLGSPRLAAQATLARAFSDYARTDYAGMARRSAAALDTLGPDGDPLLRIRGLDQLSVAAAAQLDLPELRRTSAASLQLARAVGTPTLEGWPRARLAVADLLSGEWDAALRGSAEVVTLARRYGEDRGSVSSAAVHALVLAHLGRFAAATRYLDDARAAVPAALQADRNIFGIVALAAATLALFAGRPADAAAAGARLADVGGGWLPLLGLATLGEARARSGGPEAAAGIAARLRDVVGVTTTAPGVLARWVEGVLAAARGDHAAADLAFDDAARGFGELGLPFHRARAHLERAALLAGRADGSAQGPPGGRADVDRAVGLARAAHPTFEALGATIHADRAGALLRRLGVFARRGRPRRAGRLSARELQVARLVAAGRTNADVAAALFISPRTVGTHLDHLYAKLGLSSRVALTRYLLESDLLDGGDGRT